MRASLIRCLFEEYATGSYTLSQMVKKTKEWGLRNSRGNQDYLCLSHIHSIIQNHFYYGVMKVQKTGKEYPHIYLPLISKDLFDQCQKVRLGWNKKPFKWGVKEYVFRGLITCATTGRVVTSDTKRKTYPSGEVAEWIYLRVWDRKNKNKVMFVKEDKIIEEVQKVFDLMHLDSELLEKVIKVIKNSAEAEKDHYKEEINRLQAEHTKINNRLDRLTDLFLDGEFGEAEYKEKRKSLEQKRDEILKDIESNNRADNNFAEGLTSALKLASGAGEAFKGSTLEEKRKLINFVFSNLKLNGSKLWFSLPPPFDAFVDLSKTSEWRTLVYDFRTFNQKLMGLLSSNLLTFSSK